MSRREAAFLDQGEDFGGGCGNIGTGAEDRADPGLRQKIVILRRDNAADGDEDVGMSPAPSRLSASLSAGTRVLLPAAWLDTPTIWTSFSTACRATSSGVWNSGPISTSKSDPRMVAVVAATGGP
jgi:hypothetical protein